MKTKLEKIAEKFRNIEVSESNYSIGGGLDDSKFASRRHEDAKSDESRTTLGRANQLFSKATGMTVDEVSEIIKYAVPNMEWHHAGRLPKFYGGGMKKTYFLNSAEVVKVAENFEDYRSKLDLRKEADKKAIEEKNNRTQRQLDYLKENATQVTRVNSVPEFFHETNREMNGKYGWFCSYYKSYNMPEYYTGWKFDSQEKYDEFNKI